jgi:tRNA pseudouridine55 synthase
MHGVLLVDKPEGITSNDVVGIVKRFVRPAKVGHTGTLDPAATGLVVILIGAATRALDYLNESRKEYRLTILLGEETDTDDRDGTVMRTADPSGVTSVRIDEVLAGYLSVFDQVPPRYCAIKKNGVPLYKLARKGVSVEVPARKVEVFSLVMVGWNTPLLELEMKCSKGTYARALARDIGRDLGVGGRLESLRRTASGPFRVQDALGLDEITTGGAATIRSRLIPLPSALAHIPDLPAFPAEIRRLMRGSPVNYSRSRFALLKQPTEGIARLLKIVSGNGDLIILVRPQPSGAEIALTPVKVFKAWEAG